MNRFKKCIVRGMQAPCLRIILGLILCYGVLNSSHAVVITILCSILRILQFSTHENEREPALAIINIQFACCSKAQKLGKLIRDSVLQVTY